MLSGGITQTTELDPSPGQSAMNTPGASYANSPVDEHGGNAEKFKGKSNGNGNGTGNGGEKDDEKHLSTRERRKRRQKLSANVLQQLGAAVAEVALKDSKLNRAGEIGGFLSLLDVFSECSSGHCRISLFCEAARTTIVFEPCVCDATAFTSHCRRSV